MAMYKCVRADKKGFISEILYRRGDDVFEVMADLEGLQWPEDGEWEVMSMDESEPWQVIC